MIILISRIFYSKPAILGYRWELEIADLAAAAMSNFWVPEIAGPVAGAATFDHWVPEIAWFFRHEVRGFYGPKFESQVPSDRTSVWLPPLSPKCTILSIRCEIEMASLASAAVTSYRCMPRIAASVYPITGNPKV